MPTRTTSQGRVFPFRGGAVCLDFVNTVAWRATDQPRDDLQSMDDLLAWGRQAGLLAPDDTARANADEGAGARDALIRARELRETIHRMVTAVMKGVAPEASDLLALNRFVVDMHAHLRLTCVDGSRFAWTWEDGSDAERVLWEVGRAAADLLVSGRLDRVKVCSGPGCGWIFLDASRNGSRRWCDAGDCGNRERVRRHAARKRAARTGRGGR